MARFEITTPVPGYTGRVGNTDFIRGKAQVTSDTPDGVSALAYFRSQGYGIAPLDELEVDQAIDRASLTPADEVARLKRENTELEERLSLDELRARNADLRKQVYKDESAQTESPKSPAARTGGPAPAPPDDASVADWRKHAVAELGVSEVDAKRLDKGQLQERDRQVRDELARSQDGGAQ